MNSGTLSRRNSKEQRMKSRQHGLSFAEVLMSIAIIGVLIYGVVTVTSTGLQHSKTNTDRQFAIQKALSMLEELKALVQVSQGGAITVLDNFNDQNLFRDRLTTVGAIADPADEDISGNTRLNPVGTMWLYSRQISVTPLADPANPNLVITSSDVRLVRVRVYKNQYAVGGALQGRRLLAEVASVIRTLAVSFPTTQVYDIYCVAIESIPGWWVNLSTLRPFVTAAIGDMQGRHPGLQFREHWITKASYGRDQQYRPYINSNTLDVNGTLTPIPFVYFYPGVLPQQYALTANPAEPAPPAPWAINQVTASPAQFYYPPANFGGLMQQELGAGGAPTWLNPFNADSNPFPYAIADQYNHGMRYPDELALYNQRVNAPPDPATGVNPYFGEEMTLRLLLEDMFQRPNNYLNALFINLHGELLPFPPTRNYSDAAKKPAFYTGIAPALHNGVRVVTHPENVAYDSAVAGSINLRVYSYVLDPTITGAAPGTIRLRQPNAVGLQTAFAAGKEFLSEPISVVIRGVNWNPANINGNGVRFFAGGVDLDDQKWTADGLFTGSGLVPPGPPPDYNPRDYYESGLAPMNDLAPPARRRMYYTTALTGAGDTVIKLWNSPLISPCVPTPTTCDANQSLDLAPGGPGASGGIEYDAANPQSSRRLYGLEYIPSPMENFASGVAQTPFAQNLTTRGDLSKNTARWVIEIPTNVLPNCVVPLPNPPNCGPVAIDTYIGDYNVGTDQIDSVAGVHPLETVPPTVQNIPPNSSRTFFWRGTAGWLFGGVAQNPGGGFLPITERYQIIGDPRHMPYADGKKPHAGAFAAANINARYGQAYNRYFDDFENVGEGNRSASWPGWTYGAFGLRNDGVANNAQWQTSNGNIELDVPRLYQVFRSGLMTTNSLYTTMTGWPYYYLGIGNEIGYDSANNFPYNVPVSRRPFQGTDQAGYFEQAITPGVDWGDTGNPADPVGTSGPLRISGQGGGGTSVKYIKEADNSWWSMHWLGELYPDDMYRVGGANNDWEEMGNLFAPAPPQASNAANTFLRVRRDNVPSNTAANPTHTPGTTFSFSSRRTHQQGAPTFFWTGGNTIGVTSDNACEAIPPGATGCANLFGAGASDLPPPNYSLPLDNGIPASRPFIVNAAPPAPLDAVNQAAAYTPNLQLTIWRDYYDSTTGAPANLRASSLLALREAAPSTRAVFVVENGLSQTTQAGTDFIARWSFLTLVHSYFEAGLFNGRNLPAITQLPRVRITSPNPNTDVSNPTTIPVTWALEWRRWDGRPYTSDGQYAPAANFSEPTTQDYWVMYSVDNGLTWRYINDNATAATPGVRGPQGFRYAGPTTNWNVAALPAGDYIVRVECYRQGFPLHYSFHQYQAFITR
jgi:hypothetical protein